MHKAMLAGVMFLLVSFTATAEFIGPGATSSLTTVQAVDKLKEDTRVSLVGYLINQLGVEHYTFKDDTGQMAVEIHPNELLGITVTPEIKIKIYGEVDDGKHDSKVDVDFIEILN